MSHDVVSALDAVWQANHNATEKLVLAHLTSKHELGDRSSSAWKDLPRFLQDFEDRWCTLKELETATRLSQLKLEHTITQLEQKGFVKKSTKPVKLGKRRKLQPGEEAPQEIVFAVTKKLFEESRNTGARYSRSA